MNPLTIVSERANKGKSAGGQAAHPEAGGLVAGAAIAAAVDASLLAFERRLVASPETKREGQLPPGTVAIAPILDARTLGITALVTFRWRGRRPSGSIAP